MNMAEGERDLLLALSAQSVGNIPLFRELYSCEAFHALILTPLGLPVLPCPIHADITPAMLVTLLRVIRKVHNMGWIHRDIKPDNIYLDQGSLSHIVLNDWSSAARASTECAFVGTHLFGDPPPPAGDIQNHTPTPRLDLRCLVKTSFCLSKQRSPLVKDDCHAIQQYWERVQRDYPMFSSALRFADAVNYDELEKLFLNVW